MIALRVTGSCSRCLLILAVQEPKKLGLCDNQVGYRGRTHGELLIMLRYVTVYRWALYAYTDAGMGQCMGTARCRVGAVWVPCGCQLFVCLLPLVPCPQQLLQQGTRLRL